MSAGDVGFANPRGETINVDAALRTGWRAVEAELPLIFIAIFGKCPAQPVAGGDEVSAHGIPGSIAVTGGDRVGDCSMLRNRSPLCFGDIIRPRVPDPHD